MATFDSQKSDRKACDEKLAELQAIADSDPTRRASALKFIEQLKRHRDKHVKQREERGQ